MQDAAARPHQLRARCRHHQRASRWPARPALLEGIRLFEKLAYFDHQLCQLANLNSHELQMVIHNTAGLTKAAKAFCVPTILTTVVVVHVGLLFRQITYMFPDQEVIERTFINT